MTTDAMLEYTKGWVDWEGDECDTVIPRIPDQRLKLVGMDLDDDFFRCGFVYDGVPIAWESRRR